MDTSIMFINKSQPLTGAPVRLSGDDENILITDGEGKIVIDLIQGTHVFEIQVDDAWVTHEVSRKGSSPLFVVDVGKPDTSALSTLNTLQMDLSLMVGDRYVFETILGRGGMGVVVKAIDRLLNRPVAIKMLTEELQDNDEAQQIFLVEARNLATLSHPNLVAIHDILNIEGRVLMVFEYVLGENLETKITRNGAIDQIDALRTAIQLTRCVAYLHDHELIHRDLKPANVILQADGTLKLIDFGLARSLNELYIRGTRVRGTPAYMAPEQVKGIHLTIHTDLYQIGITLFEMLAGELPFASGDLAYAHVHRDVPSLKEKVPALAPEFAALVHQLLEKQPKNRPANAHELLERLSAIYAKLTNEDYLEGLSEPSFQTGPMSAISASSVEEHFDFIEHDIDIVMPFDDPDSSESQYALSAQQPPAPQKKEFPVALIAAAVAVTAIIGVVIVQFMGSAKTPDPVPVVVAPPVVAPPVVVVEPVKTPEPVEQPVAVEPEPIEEKPVEVVAAPVRVAPVVKRAKPVTQVPAKTVAPPDPVKIEPVEEPKVAAVKPKKKKPKKVDKPQGLLSVDQDTTPKAKDSLLLPVD